MAYLIFLYILAFLLVGTLAIYFMIYFYMIIFEAEKFRQKMVSLPEYKPNWIFWVTPCEPFKWYDFHRRAIFLFYIDPVFISKRQRRKSVAARKITEVMPRYLINLFRIQDSCLTACAIGLAISCFLK